MTVRHTLRMLAARLDAATRVVSGFGVRRSSMRASGLDENNAVLAAAAVLHAADHRDLRMAAEGGRR